MGFIRSEESKKAELEEFRRLLLGSSGVYNGAAKNQLTHEVKKQGTENVRRLQREIEDDEDEEEEKLVCVTSGFSFLGLAIVNRLLDRGYSVRILVENQEDLERLEDVERFGDAGGSDDSDKRRRITVVKAKVTDDVESLCEAFQGCRGVFHTSAFADPSGVSGYSKCMAQLEVKASENVMEACARTPSVTKCVFTSSLLACIWGNNDVLSDASLPPVVLDHKSWSEESVCRDKKLWFALGKTMAERAAWRAAQESKIKLATVCPGLITGTDFCLRNSTPSIAYLKGAQEMYANGLLATADITKVAEAQVSIYEAMSSSNAHGRYICFDNIIENEEEAMELTRKIGLPADRIAGNSPISDESVQRFRLSNEKLSRLMSRRRRCF